MKQHSYIIKFSGDIGTKQPRSKWKIIEKLYSNILKGLKYDNNPVIESKLHWSHIFLTTEHDASQRLQWTPGIQYFSPVTITPLLSTDEILSRSQEIFAPLIRNKLFAVRVKNANYNKIDYSKRYLEKEIGSVLYPFAKGVNLTTPDVTCYVEIREQNCYFFAEKIYGTGGFPVGSSKESVVLYSGGIDSPVATFRALRVGVMPHFIYYDLGGDAQLQATQQTLSVLHRKFFPYQNAKIYFVPFNEIMVALQQIPNKYQNLGLKVFFYLFAQKMARYRNLSNIITGESIGQVSTQTISNLSLLERFIEYPVLRPLGFYTKNEIIAIARQLGTMDSSFQGTENCALAAKNVVTKGKFKELKEHIDRLPVDELLQQAFAQTQKFTVSDFLHYTPQEETSSATPETNDVQYIDLSLHTDYQNRKNIKQIAFNDAWQQFFDWDTEKKYYIYCENGVKSKTLANFMREQGFDATPIKQLPQ